jgi:acetyl esterase/lipase
MINNRFVQPCWIHRLTLLGVALAGLALVVPGHAQQKKKGKPTLPGGATVKKDIVYATHDGVELKLDLYRPKNEEAKSLPVVLWIHGGGWLNGSKDNCKITFLLDHGFAVASVGYRLADVAQWPGQIEDCYAAVRYLRSHAEAYGLDGDHIGAMGGSAGGHLAALMGTRAAGEEKVCSRVQAVCDWYGPTDLLIMPPNVVSETRPIEKVRQSNGARLLGTTVRDVPELAKDASAFYQVSSDDPPFLIMHGSEDPGVPVEQSKKFHEALKKAGVSSELVIVEGAGHGGPLFNTDEVREKVAAFFGRWLR